VLLPRAAALESPGERGACLIVPNHGATVAQLADAELVSLFELRTALEIEACRLALERNGGKLPTTVHDRLDSRIRA
jgi:DNA-binding GntR family transcriptional regulator